MPLTWITHQGRRILFNDLSGQRDQDAMLRQVEEELKLASAEKQKILVLLDVTGAVLGADFMKQAKVLGAKIEPFIERQAVVGVDTLKAILLTGFNLVIRKAPLKPFADAAAAKAYLVG